MGRLCIDPVAAPVHVRGTLEYVCADKRRCNLGEVHQFPFSSDRVDPSDTGRTVTLLGTLPDGEDVVLPGRCEAFGSELTGVGYEGAPLIDIVRPDCTLDLPATTVADLEDLTVRVSLDGTWSDAVVCPGVRPYGIPTPTTLDVEGFSCNGSTFAYTGRGTAECRDAKRCTVGEQVGFTYWLATFATRTTTVLLDSGDMLVAPMYCGSVRLERSTSPNPTFALEGPWSDLCGTGRMQPGTTVTFSFVDHPEVRKSFYCE